MIALKIILIITLAVSALGAAAGGEKDRRPCLSLFAIAGSMILLAVAIERM